MADNAFGIRGTLSCVLTSLVLASAAAAQAPWHPSVGLAGGKTTLNWARSWEAGVHGGVELTVPFGPYLGARLSYDLAAPPSADSTLHRPRLYTTELIGRLRVLTWRSFRAYGEMGFARVRLDDAADWADADGVVRRMQIERSGGLESVGAAVAYAFPRGLTIEVRARRIHGVMSERRIDGTPDPYFETNSLRMNRLELATSWRL